MTTFQNVILSLVVKQINSCFLQQLVTLLLQAKNAKNLVFGSLSSEWVFYNNFTIFLPAKFLPEYLRSRAYRCLSLSSPSGDRYSNLTTIEILVLISWILHPGILQLKLPSQTKNYDPRHLRPFRRSFESKITKINPTNLN